MRFPAAQKVADLDREIDDPDHDHPDVFATLLIGFGLFNLVEGIVDHQLLGLHHVNETVRRELWIYWDIGFLLWGAAMLLIGFGLLRRVRNS